MNVLNIKGDMLLTIFSIRESDVVIICVLGSLTLFTTILFVNKKVLLCERKRHTARRVASACYAALSHGWGGVVPQVPPTIQT